MPVSQQPRVGVFHPGTQHSWQTALAFQNSRILAWYATSVFYREDHFPYNVVSRSPKFLRDKITPRLKRRSHSGINTSLVRTFGIHEWVETFARSISASALAEFIDRRGNDSFGARVAETLESDNITHLWGYNNSSATAFRTARKLNIKCVLDQTIGHPLALEHSMRLQFKQYPEFFQQPPSKFSARNTTRNEEEMELADKIVVGSEFCRQTIPNAFAPKTVIIPYGHDLPIRATPRQRTGSKPRFIFVGSVGPRKGIPQLLRAFSQLRDEAELLVVGPIACPKSALSPYINERNINFIGGVSRTLVRDFLESSDYFIFPSLFEGGGIVLYEAAAAGLPIVQSAYCGDGCDGTNGEILERVDEECIADSVRRQISYSDSVYVAQSRNSLRIASSRRWHDYGESVNRAVQSI